mmetsp:Transcript_21570/g.19134  ORF Transcript_21570/g.19134 Transcript_21570/m.19134 type:complete len:108 (+) Transcript_21570:43-366(+)
MFIFDEVLSQLDQIEKWADLLLYSSNLVEMQAQQFEVCQTNEIITNIAGLFTIEGISTLGARFLGTFLADFDETTDGLIKAFNNSDVENQGFWMGKLFSLVFNYTIR